ncbi:MAG: hypothetical protein ACTHVY_05200 [Brevibacterium yomogidense]|uniref:Putative ABC transporter permease n=1 Tax=Brevibacterium yomogidense TaxID=946573 RepID=A0A1X6XJH6_9MICO|nr:hypothetical protein [Brevibacterium yomogidense]SLM99441.1 putative ABC transporter permease [Brevibacterium yomogidense]
MTTASTTTTSTSTSASTGGTTVTTTGDAARATGPIRARAADPPTSGTASTGSRILSVVRLQFVNRYTFLWIPLLIIVSAVLLSLAIYWMVDSDSPVYGGGGQAPLWYYLAVGVQAMSLTFPFSQAMSLTRREFFLGTVLAAAISALVLAAFYVLLGLFEQATDGYGINGYIAYLPWVWENGWVGTAAVVAALTMFFFLTGFWFATIYRRAGTIAVTIAVIGLALVLLAAIFIITRMEAWSSVLEFFATMGPLGLAGILAGLAVVVGTGSWVTLRRSMH